MNRADLVRAIPECGAVFVRHGARHDWYRNPKTGVPQAIPRHRVIGGRLAHRIIRLLCAAAEDASDG